MRLFKSLQTRRGIPLDSIFSSAGNSFEGVRYYLLLFTDVEILVWRYSVITEHASICLGFDL